MADGYNCPTGKCGKDTDPPCRSVKRGDTVAPNSRAHLERNACNRCPKKPPTPVYITKQNIRTGVEFKVLDRWVDHEGNTWEPDNAVTAWWYHDDPIPGFRDNGNMTFRVARVAAGGARGWQCRYKNGALDDTSKYMGTYDYAPAGTTDHVSMDVSPHGKNSNYVGGLTQKY